MARQYVSRLRGSLARRWSTISAWKRLATLTDSIGNRLSGTPELDRAIEWATAGDEERRLENVHRASVMVPHWVRGRESAKSSSRRITRLRCSDLATASARRPAVSRPAVVVHNYQELDAAASRVRGRIVVYNVPFTDYDRTRPYRPTVRHAPRSSAPSVPLSAPSAPRACGPPPHRRPQLQRECPEDSGSRHLQRRRRPLQRMSDRGERIVIRLQMEAHFEPDAPSANVVGELRGAGKARRSRRHRWSHRQLGRRRQRERRRRRHRVGVGSAAPDEEPRLRPRRTVRVVLWTNEENGGRGGLAYRDAHKAELAKTVSDARGR